MRVVGGKYRGRQLLVPPGRNIRPTSNRVRESIFNILTQGGEGIGKRNWVEKADVLDGFAGTGAMGLEAISRGASKVTVIDNDEAALNCCRKNIEALREGNNVKILSVNCLSPGPTDQPYSLIFMDPPYGLGLVVPAIAALTDNGWIAPNAITVVEMAKYEKIKPPLNFRILDQRVYGKAKILFLGNC